MNALDQPPNPDPVCVGCGQPVVPVDGQQILPSMGDSVVVCVECGLRLREVERLLTQVATDHGATVTLTAVRNGRS